MRAPLILADARLAIEESTRRLTAVVSEMNQRNGELRQQVKYLKDELALAKEYLEGGRPLKRQRKCSESENENVYLMMADPVEWQSSRECCVCKSSTGNLCYACDFSLSLRCFCLASVPVKPAMPSRLTDATPATCLSVSNVVAQLDLACCGGESNVSVRCKDNKFLERRLVLRSTLREVLGPYASRRIAGGSSHCRRVFCFPNYACS